MMYDLQMVTKIFGRIWKEIIAFEFNLEKIIGDSRESASVCYSEKT